MFLTERSCVYGHLAISMCTFSVRCAKTFCFGMLTGKCIGVEPSKEILPRYKWDDVVLLGKTVLMQLLIDRKLNHLVLSSTTLFPNLYSILVDFFVRFKQVVLIRECGKSSMDLLLTYRTGQAMDNRGQATSLCHQCRSLVAVMTFNQGFLASPQQQPSKSTSLDQKTLQTVRQNVPHHSNLIAYKQQPRYAEPLAVQYSTSGQLVCLRCTNCRL